MSIFTWAIFGMIAGIVANAIDPEPSQGGLLGAIVLGVVGALVGGFLADLVFGVGLTGFNISSLIVAVLGALLVLMAGRALRRA